MRKVIATMNMTLDGFCDHTAMNADDEIHQHYTELINASGTIIYGRKTYQLMEEFWPGVVKKPLDHKAMDDFAVALENIQKVVFSRTLKSVGWKNVQLAKKDVKEEIMELRQQPGKDILVGSPGLIVACMKLNLLDEYQISVQPIVVGSGLPLFKGITERTELKLIKTKTFKGTGAVTFYCQPKN